MSGRKSIKTGHNIVYCVFVTKQSMCWKLKSTFYCIIPLYKNLVVLKHNTETVEYTCVQSNNNYQRAVLVLRTMADICQSNVCMCFLLLKSNMTYVRHWVVNTAIVASSWGISLNLIVIWLRNCSSVYFNTVNQLFQRIC